MHRHTVGVLFVFSFSSVPLLCAPCLSSLRLFFLSVNSGIGAAGVSAPSGKEAGMFRHRQPAPCTGSAHPGGTRQEVQQMLPERELLSGRSPAGKDSGIPL